MVCLLNLVTFDARQYCLFRSRLFDILHQLLKCIVYKACSMLLFFVNQVFFWFHKTYQQLKIVFFSTSILNVFVRHLVFSKMRLKKKQNQQFDDVLRTKRNNVKKFIIIGITDFVPKTDNPNLCFVRNWRCPVFLR